MARSRSQLIDRVRLDMANLLRDDQPARKVLKRSRELLLSNRAAFKIEQVVQLQELLQPNQPVATHRLPSKGCTQGNRVRPSVWMGWRYW